MRKLKLLGIIGGSSSILYAVLYILIDFTSVSSLSFDLRLVDPLNLLLSIIAASGGVLGIIGGFISVKRKIFGGIIMIVSAAASILSIMGIVATAILIFGGVQAFIYKEEDKTNNQESDEVKNKKGTWIDGLIFVPALALIYVMQKILIILLKDAINNNYLADFDFITFIFIWVSFLLGVFYMLIANVLSNKYKKNKEKEDIK